MAILHQRQLTLVIDTGNTESHAHDKQLHVQLPLVLLHVQYRLQSNSIAHTFIRVTCRPLITSLNSFNRVCNSIIHLYLEIIIEYKYIDVSN